MPEYEFCCVSKKCGNEFKALCSFQDYDEGFKNVKCPKCGKKKPKKVFSLNSVHFVGNPDKMNNFEYAAHKNFDKAQQESAGARDEARKKGVVSPYADLPDFTNNGNRMNFVD
jgi:putative FmdB family regulatory protein